MGLQDRDYVHERRERPFTPPGESEASTWLIVLVLALAGYGLYQAYERWWLPRARTTQASAQTAVPGRSVPARPVTSVPAQAAPATTITLYHCKGYDGRTFWANSHCNQHRALVDRLVNVPAHLSFDQQVAIANGQRQAAQQMLDQQAATASASDPGADSKVVQCSGLDEQVRRLDAMARQPQTGSMQDWIRSQRQKLRDTQFRLRC